jgi:hypothetical protein
MVTFKAEMPPELTRAIFDNARRQSAPVESDQRQQSLQKRPTPEEIRSQRLHILRLNVESQREHHRRFDELIQGGLANLRAACVRRHTEFAGHHGAHADVLRLYRYRADQLVTLCDGEWNAAQSLALVESQLAEAEALEGRLAADSRPGTAAETSAASIKEV